MDIIQFYQDYNINYKEEGEHKHARPGWVNTPCPFCIGNPGYHLGYQINQEYFFCWRCGWHSVVDVIAALAGVSFKEAKRLAKLYGMTGVIIKKTKKAKPKKPYQMPSNIISLSDRHKEYLSKRGYDPEFLERYWYLTATGPLSRLDKINYNWRIIIPIIWNAEACSFTSRDITGINDLKYISCPKDREKIEHKTILYGKQELWKPTGICVEGPTDVWRLGTNSFGLFGIEYTRTQIRLIANTFKKVVVIFDPDPQAQRMAKKLVNELKFRGVDAYNLTLDTDPGSMSQDDANHLLKEINFEV